MTQRIHLLGGVDLMSGRVSPLDRAWLRAAADGPICIADLTSRDVAARPRYRAAMQAYFSRATKKDLVFVSELPSRAAIASAFQSAGALYIPGGDTEALLDEVTRRDLVPLFQSATCLVAGNSAGAVAICREAVLTTDHTVTTPTVRPGLGLVDFSVDPHYNSTHDRELVVLSAGRVVFGIPEESAIVVVAGTTQFFGPAWRFTDGKRQRVG